MSRLASAVFGLAFGVLTASTATAEVTKESVREVLERAGVVARIVNETADRDYRIAKVGARETQGLPPEVTERLLTLLRSIADAEILIEVSVRTLAERWSKRERDEVDAFYASPLGRRIVALEVAASTTEALDRIHDESEKLEGWLGGKPVRKMLLEWLDEALLMSDREASYRASLEVGHSRGLAFARQEEPANSFDNQFKAVKADLDWQFRKETMHKLAYTYGPLTDSEILEYLRFLDTSAGKRFSGVLEIVTTASFMEAGIRLGENIAALLSEASN